MDCTDSYRLETDNLLETIEGDISSLQDEKQSFESVSRSMEEIFDWDDKPPSFNSIHDGIMDPKSSPKYNKSLHNLSANQTLGWHHNINEVYEKYVSNVYEQKIQKLHADFEGDFKEIMSNLTESITNVSNEKHPPKNPAGKRKRETLDKPSRQFLKAWLREHRKNPYPTEEEKIELAKQTGLTLTQINNWFVNGRKRYLPSTSATPPHVRRKIEMKNQLLNRFKDNQK